jgi:uncharacterized protein (TIGR02594 family)
MPKWKITAEFQPLTSPGRFGKTVFKEGDSKPYTVHDGDRIDGVNEGDWIKTRIDGVTPDEVYIPLKLAQLDAPLSPEPIRSEERDAFCDLVTTTARDYETDRNYLMAWAFLGTNNLQEMGQPGDGKIGPFQFSAEDWQTAITGPAKDLSLSAQERRSWHDQIPVAALVLKDCIQRLQSASATNELPTRLEVYFAQKFGPGAEEVLEQPRTDRCRDRIKNPAAGTYAAELAKSDKTIQTALDDLRAPLESGFKAAYTLIDTRPPEIRFFDESDLPPAAGTSAPWLKVAIDEMKRGVTRDANDKNTADIEAYFKVTGTPDSKLHEAWCAAFVAYCMKNCGVAEVASSMSSVPNPAGAANWIKWGKPAEGNPPIGCVVVLKPQEKGSSGHVGFLHESSDGKTVKLLAGNQKKQGEEHNHVGVVEFPVDGEKGVVGFRWLEVAQVPVAPSAGVGNNPEDQKVARFQPMLDFIAQHEGTANQKGGGYNTSLGFGKFTGGEKTLVEMTLLQIDVLQTQMLNNPENHFRSSALGRYQIVQKTLQGLKTKLELSQTVVFDQKLQDRLGVALILGRGRNVAGLRQEWASLKRVDSTKILAAFDTDGSARA